MDDIEGLAHPRGTEPRDHDALLADVFASAPDAGIVIDLSGIVLGLNRAAERLYGWSDSIIGRPIDAMTDGYGPRAFPAALDAVAHGHDSEPFGWISIASNGRTVSTWVRVVPVVGVGGNVVAALISGQEEGDPATRDAERGAARSFGRVYAANVIGIFFGVYDRIVEGNSAFLTAIGASPGDLRRGLALGAVFSPDSPMAAPFVDGVGREYEVTRLDGASAHVFAVGISLGAEGGWVGVALDLTERRKAERATARLALHDPVTGVPNRRLLMDRVQQALLRAGRGNRVVAVLFCDVDHFKDVNDTHGHRVGDEILQAVARRLESVLRGDDTVARVGGDEFVIVLQDLSDPTEATRIAERARIAVHEAIPIGDQGDDVRVTVSIGVSFSFGPLDDGEALIRRADEAMYLAKQRGRAQVAFSDYSLREGGSPEPRADPSGT